MTLEERILELEKKLKETKDPLERRKIINKIESLEEFGGIRVDDIEELDVMCITQQGIKSLTSG